MAVSAYSRKKQPEAVRRAILDEAQRIAAARGLSDLTIQGVASAAGVTKGGVFHHFASKDALLTAMFDDIMARIDAEIDERMAGDDGYGRFTRAYVQALTTGHQFGIGSTFDALSMAAIANPEMSRSWLAWLEARLGQHADTDGAPVLEVVRLAADGAWLNYANVEGSAEKLQDVADRLVAMTRL